MSGLTFDLILVLILLCVSLFGFKSCYENEISRLDKKKAEYRNLGYIEQEYCSAYQKKWVKP